MTDKEKLDAIRAEIHRLVDVRGYDRGMANDLFTFMDSLPNEPVSNDLEKEIKRFTMSKELYEGEYGHSSEDIHPSTKEQRELLFEKMHEAEYMWNAEKKELRKIKQNPTEWSEEDEEHLNSIISDIKTDMGAYPRSQEVIDIYNDDISFLKSLRDRVQPQPKQEWSEEDEDMIQALDACIDAAIKGGMNYISFGSKSILIGKIKNRLKSLKQRYTWKPSDGQMEALKEACDKNWEPDGLDPLYTLYQDLEKLKGE